MKIAPVRIFSSKKINFMQARKKDLESSINNDKKVITQGAETIQPVGLAVSNAIKTNKAFDNPDKVLKSFEEEADKSSKQALKEIQTAQKEAAEIIKVFNEEAKDGKLCSSILDLFVKGNKYAPDGTLLREIKRSKKGYQGTLEEYTPDDGAYVRAQVQDKHWDKGERSIVDVLMQSTLMQLGSQGSYDSLTDIRGGKFSTNPQGLVETEKTFIESVVENNEKMSIRYQKVDDNQNLVGWECDFNKIQKHIINTLNTGEDVIIGYVLTNETSGKTKKAGYVNTVDNAPNKIINGHEITIVGYKTDNNGKVTFICNDTDDDKSELIEYSADFLIPKIHHAAYPVAMIEDDMALIEAQQMAA